MDIQLASNFERLLFELAGRDASRIRSLMEDLRAQGSFALSQGEFGQLSDLFSAHSAGEDLTQMTIRGVFEETGMVVDPHTAVGIAAAQQEIGLGKTPMIVLATAHAAKFPDAVQRAIGAPPPQPERLAVKLGSEERCAMLPADFDAVSSFVVERAQAAAPLTGAEA